MAASSPELLALAERLRSAMLQLWIRDNAGDACAWHPPPEGWEEVKDFSLDTYLRIAALVGLPHAARLADALGWVLARPARLQAENERLTAELVRLRAENERLNAEIALLKEKRNARKPGRP